MTHFMVSTNTNAAQPEAIIYQAQKHANFIRWGGVVGRQAQ
jgi:hypothetical protein